MSRSEETVRSPSLGERGCGVAGYALWEWLPRGPACGRGWLYNPTRAALPPPVDRSPDLTDLLRGTLFGQACLAPLCNKRELPSTRAPDLLPERRVPSARCTAAPSGPGTTFLVSRPRSESSSRRELDPATRVRCFPPLGVGTPPGWWTLLANLFTR